jgi:hypothetical protein
VGENFAVGKNPTGIPLKIAEKFTPRSELGEFLSNKKAPVKIN